MGDPIRIVIIEDQRHTREGLAALIGGSSGMEIAAQYRSGEEALGDVKYRRPGVVLTDLGLPGISGTEVVARLRELLPGVPILVLTVHGEDQHVFDALCAGACGYLLKDIEPARLLSAIREVHGGGAPMSPEIARRVVGMFQRYASPKSGESGLSPRELEVLNLLADGDSYKVCADRLAISIDTVRFHVRRIYDRLHVHSRSAAVSTAMRRGWIR
ncbi:MAG TPA: response regulator transcription factor [Candidatus Acidoferrales bacterium]|nr:response regulator transcription factor [Candidatus Acidoferrales bacterium]